MKDRSRFSALLLAIALSSGCSSNSEESADAEAGRASDNVETNTATAPASTKFETKLTQAELTRFEKTLSGQLPADYCSFLLSSNGSFPAADCIVFEEAGVKTAADVFCFLAIDDERPWASVQWHMDTFKGRLPQGTVPIARDSCGNLWLLSVADGTGGYVTFWDPGSYATFDETDLKNWPKVASSFTEFRGLLTKYDPAFESGKVPTRYSLVKQALASMAKREPGFTGQGHPDFVWHCDCDEKGNVSMQFIQYQMHATFTHTCGYNRLRAIHGLIEGGATRLPQ